MAFFVELIVHITYNSVVKAESQCSVFELFYSCGKGLMLHKNDKKDKGDKETLILYSTLGCHLCDLAVEVIAHCSEAREKNVCSIDIADDDDLVARYGVRIPVIAYAGKELGWPFTADELSVFLMA